MKTKICTKCSVEKLLSEFSKDKSKKNGIYPACKECINKIHRKNRIKIAKQNSEYHKRIAKYNKYYISNIGFADNIKRGSTGDLLISCTYCGKFFSPTNLDVQNRIRAINGKLRGECRLYCCKACKHACPSYNQEKYWKDKKPATSREVGAYFRQAVLERDNWTCQRCGSGAEKQLHVHHIEGVTQQPRMSNDLENGITLCKECHKYIHSQEGCKYYELRCQQTNK